jgi:plastocyanin
MIKSFGLSVKWFMKKLVWICVTVLALICGARAATFVITAQSGFPSGNTFSPSAISIGIGDSVVFTNSSGQHDVTGYNPPAPPERFCGTTPVNPGLMCIATFTNTGVFQFRCTPHSTGSGTTFSGMIGSITVTSPPLPSLVVITSPVENAFFAAPANLTIRARATAQFSPPATVTNMQFFANETLVGLDTASPFFVTVTNLAAGVYALTARAKDTRSLIGTSAPVNIRVIEGPLLVAKPGTNGPIQFSYNTGTGLSYVVQATTDPVTNWSGVTTNRATTTNQTYTEKADAGPLRFYRVLVQP